MALGNDICLQLEARASEPVLYYRVQVYSGAEFLALVRGLERLWSGANLSPGTPIALLARNRPLHIAALVASLAARARTSMVATSQNPARIAEDVRARCPAIVVAAREDWSDDLAASTRDIGALAIELAADGAARRAEPTGTRSSPAPDPDIAFDLLSSGTTSRPSRSRSAGSRYSEAIDDARAVYATPPGNATPADTTTLQRPPAVVIQPLANVAGVTFVVPALAHGQPIVLMEKFELDSWTAIVEQYGPPRTSLPPAALRMILDANVAPHRLASLKVIGIGGARLDESLRTEFEARYGIVLVPAYGATELGSHRELEPR